MKNDAGFNRNNLTEEAPRIAEKAAMPEVPKETPERKEKAVSLSDACRFYEKAVDSLEAAARKVDNTERVLAEKIREHGPVICGNTVYRLDNNGELRREVCKLASTISL